MKEIVLFALLTGCTTPQSLTIEDLKVGSVLNASDPSAETCSLKVSSIFTVERTNRGWIPMEVPVVCGPVTCTKKSDGFTGLISDTMCADLLSFKETENNYPKKDVNHGN